MTDAGGEVVPVRGLAGFVVGLLEEGHPGGVGQVIRSLARVGELDVVLRGEESLPVGTRGELLGGAEVDDRLSFLTLLEGDHDDAVGGLGAVGGQGGGVLQDADGLDGVLVDIFQVAGEDDAVHDQQRSGAGGVDGTAAAHADAGIAAHVGGFSAHHDTGEAAAHHVGHVAQAQVGDRSVPVGLHDVHGAGEVLRAGCTVTDDHDVVQDLGVEFQFDGDVVPVTDSDFHVLVTDAGDDQHVTGGAVELEVTVNVGGDTGGGALDHDGGADDALVGLVKDDALDGLVLGGQQGCAEDDSPERQQQPLRQVVDSHFVVG